MVKKDSRNFLNYIMAKKCLYKYLVKNQFLQLFLSELQHKNMATNNFVENWCCVPRFSNVFC